MIGPVLALAQAASIPCAYTAGPATVAVPGRPFVAEPSADGCTLYVPLAGDRGGAVAVLENRDGAFRLARVTPLREAATGAALSPDGAVLAVAAGDGVTLLDAAALRTPADDPRAVAVPLGGASEPIEALFSREGARLFVSLERAAAIAVVDVARARAGAGAGAVVGRVPQAQAPVGLALSPDGARLYATSQTAGAGAETCAAEQGGGGRAHARGAVFVIDAARAASDPAHAVVGGAPAGCNPVRVAASPDGTRVWVTARGDGELLGFDAGALSGRAEPVVRVKVGTSPVGVALSPDGARAWVSASDRFGGGSAALVQVDLSARPPAVSRRLPADGFPRDLRLLPDGRTLAAALYTGRAIRLEPAGAP
jgi:DNA-binding beta-propeller fold protein YncE